MRINIPWNRYALIVELADRFKERIPKFGKTLLQKMVYLLQEVYGVNCGYRFELYTYGPFSSELLQDLDLVESLGGVTVVPVISGVGGYMILPGEYSELLKKKAESFLSDEKTLSALDNVVKNFGNYLAKDLELRSTIIY
ncbi:MAG: restriction endonuclease, partial [Thermotogae bacterium]